jgi:tRNA pseudouridine65 synthase
MSDLAILVLWSDETVLVVSKPSGLLTHNSAWAGPREESLRQLLLRQEGGALHPVQRLDRGASGLVVFARSPEATRAWQEALADENAVKLYLALVRGQLAESVTVDHPIRDARAGGSELAARPAQSEVRPLASSEVDRCSLVELRLRQGRRHQARRHLKHISHPVIGDSTWGKGEVNRRYGERYGLSRLALHCACLLVRHPMTGEALTLRAPIPSDLVAPLALLFPAEVLEEALEAIGHRDQEQG